MNLAELWSWSFAASVWLLALGWLWQLWLWLRHLHELVDLTSNGSADVTRMRSVSSALPQVTVIVPACNEEASIEATLRSLMASQGVCLRIIAVDDRSTDLTGAIMDRIALERPTTEHSIQVLHIAELPLGWLGKPHALATAAMLASADWLLFTDGDVVFAPQAISLALGYALAEGADHLVLMPDWTTKTHGEAAMHGAMHAISTWTMRLWRVADPKSRDFLGVGAFNLVRRETYVAIGGFTALRMEVLEDLRLGWMLKRAGYRQRVALGAGLVSVRWSMGAWGVVRNLEKNMFALYRYKIALVTLACLGLAVQIAWPLVGLIVGGWARVAGVGLYLAIAGLYVASRKVTRVAPAYVLLFPFAASLFLFAIVRSATLALGRHGVVWRGTLYSLKELRAEAGRFW